MNKVILKGRLGADPDVRATNTGKQVAQLRLAVDRRGKDAGADWFNVIAWEQRASFAQQYLAKGRAILVEGHLSSRTYETQNGEKRTVVEVIAENIEFADSRPQGAAQAAPQATAAPQHAPAAPTPAAPAPQAYAPAAPAAPMPSQGAYAPISDDDIPF